MPVTAVATLTASTTSTATTAAATLTARTAAWWRTMLVGCRRNVSSRDVGRCGGTFGRRYCLVFWICH
jgi:hypothetical protein